MQKTTHDLREEEQITYQIILAVISCQHCWDHYEKDKNISELLNCYNDLRSCEENIALKVPNTTCST